MSESVMRVLKICGWSSQAVDRLCILESSRGPRVLELAGREVTRTFENSIMNSVSIVDTKISTGEALRTLILIVIYEYDDLVCVCIYLCRRITDSTFYEHDSLTDMMIVTANCTMSKSPSAP